MRYAYCLAALAATVAALPKPDVSTAEEKFIIELEGGEHREVTETEKFKLKLVSKSPLLMSLTHLLNDKRTHILHIPLTTTTTTGRHQLLRHHRIPRLQPRIPLQTPGRHLPQHPEPRNLGQGPQRQTLLLNHPDQPEDLLRLQQPLLQGHHRQAIL